MKTKKEKQTYLLTLTDTFCGEANFAWVRTKSIEGPIAYWRQRTAKTIFAKAKKAFGLAGRWKLTRCHVCLWMDYDCVRLFIEPVDAKDLPDFL